MSTEANNSVRQRWRRMHESANVAAVSMEATKALVRRYIEDGLNCHDFSVMDEVLADDFVAHGPRARPPRSVRLVCMRSESHETS